MRHLTRLLFALAVLLGVASGDLRAQLTEDNFNRAISGMMSANSRAAKIGKIRHVPSITVIRLRQIVVFRHPGDEPNVPAIEISAQKNAGGIARLRAALRANPVTRAALADKGVPINRIVAVEVFSNGALTVYIL
jgi:hypothetical protein